MAGADGADSAGVTGPSALVKRRQDLLARDDLIAGPARGAADVHVFDESQLGIETTRFGKERQEFAVVHAADDNRVDLESGKDARRSLETRADPPEFVCSREAQEGVAIERVEADGDPLQASRAQRLSLIGEQDAVGRERQILHAVDGGQLRDQGREIAPEQWFPASETHPAHAEPHEHLRQPDDLFEVEDVALRQPAVLRLRHAVEAAEVAAVRHRQAKAGQRPLERVDGGAHRPSSAFNCALWRMTCAVSQSPI